MKSEDKKSHLCVTGVENTHSLEGDPGGGNIVAWGFLVEKVQLVPTKRILVLILTVGETLVF